MALIQYEPWNMLKHIKEDVDNLFNNNLLLNPKNMPHFTHGEVWPQVDIEDKANHYLLKANLPGMEAKDLNIEFENGMLTISGEMCSEHKEKKGKHFICTERSTGSFYRQFRLDNVKEDAKINASFKNGVLTIEIPKIKIKGKSKRRIEIKSS